LNREATEKVKVQDELAAAERDLTAAKQELTAAAEREAAAAAALAAAKQELTAAAAALAAAEAEKTEAQEAKKIKKENRTSKNKTAKAAAEAETATAKAETAKAKAEAETAKARAAEAETAKAKAEALAAKAEAEALAAEARAALAAENNQKLQDENSKLRTINANLERNKNIEIEVLKAKLQKTKDQSEILDNSISTFKNFQTNIEKRIESGNLEAMRPRHVFIQKIKSISDDTPLNQKITQIMQSITDFIQNINQDLPVSNSKDITQKTTSSNTPIQPSNSSTITGLNNVYKPPSQPNSSFSQPNSSHLQTFSSFSQPNSSHLQTFSSFSQPNSSHSQTFSSFSQPNSSHLQNNRRGGNKIPNNKKYPNIDSDKHPINVAYKTNYNDVFSKGLDTPDKLIKLIHNFTLTRESNTKLEIQEIFNKINVTNMFEDKYKTDFTFNLSRSEESLKYFVNYNLLKSKYLDNKSIIQQKVTELKEIISKDGNIRTIQTKIHELVIETTKLLFCVNSFKNDAFLKYIALKHNNDSESIEPVNYVLQKHYTLLENLKKIYEPSSSTEEIKQKKVKLLLAHPVISTIYDTIIPDTHTYKAYKDHLTDEFKKYVFNDSSKRPYIYEKIDVLKYPTQFQENGSLRLLKGGESTYFRNYSKKNMDISTPILEKNIFGSGNTTKKSLPTICSDESIKTTVNKSHDLIQPSPKINMGGDETIINNFGGGIPEAKNEFCENEVDAKCREIKTSLNIYKTVEDRKYLEDKYRKNSVANESKIVETKRRKIKNNNKKTLKNNKYSI
jgi:hypothetical protein